jgi:DNA-binding MarR family transcriptional regulator
MSSYLMRNIVMTTKKDLVERQLDDWTEERPDLDSSPLAIVTRVHVLGKRFRRETRKALRPFRLELWEYDVLAALRRQGEPFELPPTTLAKLGMLTTGAMTNRIDRLEERDLVERRPDPEDRRSLYVKLTAKGLNLIDQAVSARMKAAAASISILNDGETGTLEHLLKKLILSSERSG